jgi:hypothetical protein
MAKNEVTATPGGQPARLQFLYDWQTVQQGQITPGAELIVDYDTNRLRWVGKWRHGAFVWEVEVFIRFHPGGQLHHESAFEPVRPYAERVPRLLTYLVPVEATKVEIWFRASGVDQIGWDSRFSQNYWFDVTR